MNIHSFLSLLQITIHLASNLFARANKPKKGRHKRNKRVRGKKKNVKKKKANLRSIFIKSVRKASLRNKGGKMDTASVIRNNFIFRDGRGSSVWNVATQRVAVVSFDASGGWRERRWYYQRVVDLLPTFRFVAFKLWGLRWFFLKSAFLDFKSFIREQTKKMNRNKKT